jgi:diguanylate cyclase (GGDEF)-like protein
MGIAFDLRTAVLVGALLTFLTGLVLLCAQQVFVRPTRDGLRWWLSGLLLHPIGFTLLGLRDVVPDALSIVVANGVIAASIACLGLGLRVLLILPERRMVLAALVGATLVLVLVFTYVYPSILVRICLVSLLLAAICGHALIAIYSRGVRVSAVSHIVALCFGIALLALLYRVLYFALLRPEASQVFVLNSAQIVVYLMTGLLPLTSTVGFLLLCAERSMVELQHTARTDYLTGVMNRRAIEESGRQAVAAARRHGGLLAVVAIDVDHFKRVNDELGHAAGDEMLMQCVQRIRGSMRAEDIIGRQGGEEFVVLMSGTDLDRAAMAAERIRREFSARPFVLSAGQRVASVSLGVAALTAADGHFSDLQRRADRAMYAAKEAGRDCTMIERDARLMAYRPAFALATGQD